MNGTLTCSTSPLATGGSATGVVGQAGVVVEVRLLKRGDEDATIEAARLFGAAGDLDPVAVLSRSETALMIAEDEGGVSVWVYGHELIHPDGERTMLLYALDVAGRARR